MVKKMKCGNMKKIIGLIVLFTVMVFVCGCSTLEYVGEDYNVSNKETVKTSEDFIFNVYKKSLQNANVKIGISKTPIMEVLALYVQIENLSYETPYIFKVEDLFISNPDKNLQFITSNNYLSIWQNQETSSMSSLSAMGSTLQNMTGMTANYNEMNQSIIQNTAQETNKSTYSRLETVGNSILKHSVKYSSTISPRRSQYYYFFFEDLQKFPITVRYKNLTYQFNL